MPSMTLFRQGLTICTFESFLDDNQCHQLPSPVKTTFTPRAFQ